MISLRLLEKIFQTAIELPIFTTSMASNIASNDMELNNQSVGAITQAVIPDCKTKGSIDCERRYMAKQYTAALMITEKE